MKKDIWSKKVPPAKNIGAFIKAAPKEVQTKLKELHKIIKSAAPKSEEGISYKMPYYKQHGMIAGFAHFKDHIGFFGSIPPGLKAQVKKYQTSVGTLQFPLDKALPAGLIKKIVKARIKNNESKK